MAICSRDAFPSVRRWQDCAVMRSWPDWQWQYSCAVRSRAAIRGNFFAPCIPKAVSDGKIAPSWQDMRAMHPKCPANRRWRIHRAKILPGRGTFRCTGPSNHARRANLAIRRRRSTLAPATPAPPNSTEQHEAPATTPPPSWQRATHSIRGASGSHTANAPTPHRPATLRRQADVKSCAARAPQRQSAARGPTAP